MDLKNEDALILYLCSDPNDWYTDIEKTKIKLLFEYFMWIAHTLVMFFLSTQYTMGLIREHY